MVFNRFSYLVLLRLSCLVIAILCLIYTFSQHQYYSVTLLVGLISIGLFYELFKFLNKENEQFMRFIESAKHGDFGQELESSQSLAMMKGKGYESLAQLLSETISDLQESRKKQQKTQLHQKALIEHIPVPMMSILSDESILLHNNAARKMFGLAMPTKLEDLSNFGAEFSISIQGLSPGDKKLVNFYCDGVNQQLTVMASQFIVGTDKEILVSMQDIQGELDHVQLRAWQDLVSVLTHEIMNSITPVCSLADTTTDMVLELYTFVDSIATQAQLSNQDRQFKHILNELKDIKRAVETVARRSDGLIKFVESYKSLTRMPIPNKSMLTVSELFSNIKKLVSTQMHDLGIHFESGVEPSSLQVFADKDLIEQILINLIKNAQQALIGNDLNSTTKNIILSSKLNQRGRVVMSVKDNGPGVPAALAEHIFIPFYTTKKDGSGVGLAFTRQVMVAHEGSVALQTNKDSGATISLTF
jgi:two-component system, NtrC family, nitrogen regulation sensor histidine kinase NtrY